MVLSHNVIKKILDYILNISTEIDHLLIFLRKYSLICKEWNLKIIPKLAMCNEMSTKDRNVDLLDKFIHISDRYDFINYSWGIKAYTKSLDRSEQYKLADHVTTISVNKLEHLSTIDQYTKLERIRIEKLKAAKGQLKSRDQLVNKKVQYIFESYGEFNFYSDVKLDDCGETNYVSMDMMDILFNNRGWHFTDVCLEYFIIFSNTKPLPSIIEDSQPNQLKKLVLYSILIEQPLLFSILENLPLVETLSLTAVRFPNSNPKYYDNVLEKVQSVSLPNLRKFSITTEIVVTFSTFISFLNKIKAPKVLYNLEKIESESDEQLQNAIIDNPHIKNFNFFNMQGLFTHKPKEDFNLYSIWKSKESLEKIRIFSCMNFNNTGKELVNLHTVGIMDPNRVLQYNTMENIKDIVQMKLPKLRSILLLSMDTSILDPKIFMGVEFLDRLDLPTIKFKTLCDILELKSLVSKINVRYIRALEFDNIAQQLSDSLSKNKLLTELFFYSINVAYDKYQLYIDILKKCNLKKISLPNYKKASPVTTSHLKQFREVLSQIDPDLLPYSIDISSPSPDENHKELGNLLSKYAIVFRYP
ncbi:hypothetical protein DLAC_09579 [Tieghemostelium lacteum]|uniref:Uncharacterized protein n=1 Tax=Tieghemostelium lacteum TaxID=361077 RepID=A0A151Z6M7_TIELA|nr:hypothetical protein DLAC_09579 [Tieghemostelium lacteum]|eukprot:KYQ89616.1 hypothetical protein DLAC_09579 [Tieghemostelium lacteum]